MTADPFIEAARAEAERQNPVPPTYDPKGPSQWERLLAQQAFRNGAEWARTHLAAQESSVLMTSCEETISDRLSDAGYTEYAEDEDGGLTWVSAPLGEVLYIVSAATETASRAVRSWRAMYRVAEGERDKALAALEAEPTDAEVEAAKAVLDSVEYADEPQSIRAALSAARAARRDEKGKP